MDDNDIPTASDIINHALRLEFRRGMVEAYRDILENYAFLGDTSEDEIRRKIMDLEREQKPKRED
jgi:hypothetical protein